MSIFAIQRIGPMTTTLTTVSCICFGEALAKSAPPWFLAKARAVHGCSDAAMELRVARVMGG